MFVALNAQTFLQTSFETSESPAYSAATIIGQNSWTGTAGQAAVTTANVRTGSQALNFVTSSAALQINRDFYSGSVPGITADVYMDVWIRIASISGSGSGFMINGYDLYGGSSKRLWAIDFRGDNKIYVNSASAQNIGNWTANTWMRVSVKMDISAEKYKVAINGNVVTNPATTTTDFPIRETYTPTASGTRVATTKEFHALRFTGAAVSVNINADDMYVGTDAISDISFGSSSTTRTITVNQPQYGNITLNPASGPYTLGQSVTATLTVPQGYKNNGWTGDLSGTTYSETFTVSGNMTVGADVGIDASNPPPKYLVTVNQPANGTITLSPTAVNNEYYSETVVTASISYTACYQFNGWTGDLSGTQTSKSFTVQSASTIGANISANAATPQVRTASTINNFKTALAAMNPGDTVILEDGTYTLGSLTINRSGCPDKPIVVMARNVGGATFTGNTTFNINGVSYVQVKGFQFKMSDPGTGMKIQNSSYCRITQNTFKITETTSCNWLYIGDTYASTDPLKSGHNMIDHNLFEGKTTAGKFIVFDGNINMQSQHDTVAYNHFKNNGPRADNEKESIRVGVTTLTQSSGFTVIEHNLFEDCDGDPEIVSIKSCDNIVRYNTFVRCLGTVCLRQGSRSTVEGNYFFGEGKTAQFTNSNNNTSTIGAGGVRVYGLDHKIINNYFSGLTGSRWDAAITITNGDDHNYPGANNSHHVPENLIVAYNTLVNNASNIEIGFDNSGSYGSKPINCVIENNIVVENNAPIVKSYSANSLIGVTFTNNIMYPTGTSSIGITANASQINNVNPQLVLPFCFDENGVDCDNTRAYQVYRLSAASPAVNAGTGSYAYITKDVEGQTRTGTKDIGADEYLGDDNFVYQGPMEPSNVGPSAVSYVYHYSFSGALPVRLLNFTGVNNNESVIVKWNVSEEKNVKQYEVEWSSDNRNFEKIAEIIALNKSAYSALHNNPLSGKNYYRLKIVDADGSFIYSNIITIDTKTSDIRIYPNPAKDFLNIEFKNINEKAQIKLMNVAGVIVKSQSLTATSMHKMNINNLPAGLYHLQIIQNNNTIHKTINIIK